MTRCACCNREFRSTAAKERAERFAAIHADLRGERPALHLQPKITYSSDLPKHERHRLESSEHRLGQR